MTPLNEAVAEWRRKQEKHVVQTKQYGKTAKEIDRLLTRIRELEAEVEEANDNATWWRNRYTAMEKSCGNREEYITKLLGRINKVLDICDKLDNYLDVSDVIEIKNILIGGNENKND